MEKMKKTIQVAIDGACSDNGKLGAIGGIGLLISTKAEVVRIFKGLDNSRIPEFAHMTNNYAEFSALLFAILWAKAHNYSSISAFSDSALVVGAFSTTKKWKIKEPQLLFLIGKIENILSKNGISLEVSLIPREKNAIADKLSKMGISNAIEGNFNFVETATAKQIRINKRKGL